MASMPEDDDNGSTALSGDIRSLVRLLDYKVSQLDKKLDQFFVEVKSNYATKSDLTTVKEDVEKLNSNISWLVKIVILAVVSAVLGLVLIKGVPAGGVH